MTEDADLGARLARFGYRSETISLPTLEDAIDGLAREGFRMTPALRAWALQAAGETPRERG